MNNSQVETLQASQAELRSHVDELKNVVQKLSHKNNKSDDGSNSSEASDVSIGVKCVLLYWCEQEDVVVREGELCSSDPVYKIGHILLGRNAAAVIVKSVSKENVDVWRPSETIMKLDQAVGVKIAWPFEKIILQNDMDSLSANKSACSSATDSSKIYIFYYTMDGVIIGEGRLCSTDPKHMVSNIPIGPQAGSVTVDKVFAEDAFLWRPISSEISTMGKALHQEIAWPIQHIQFMSNSEKEKTPENISSSKSLSNSSGGSSSKAGKKKCILLDCKNSGIQVAEGKVLSTDPLEKVHFVPLGLNASKKMVEVAKVGEAKVWRPNSEIEVIADAVGSTVAWPTDKLLFV